MVVADLPLARAAGRLRDVGHDETTHLCAQRPPVAAGGAEVYAAIDARVERLVRCLREASVGAHDAGQGLRCERELRAVAEVCAQHRGRRGANGCVP